jgi:glucose/arabinose dehydrogenase
MFLRRERMKAARRFATAAAAARGWLMLVPAVMTVLGGRPLHAGLAGLQRVTAGLNAPMFTTFAPGDPNHLYVAERGSPNPSTNATALIRVLDLQTGTLESTPFLTITGLDNNGEGGLLGLAFDPNYQTNGKFYVNVTAPDSISGTPFSNYIRQYTRSAGNPLVADPAATSILTYAQPQNNHNGGFIGFSPKDHFLYIMTGDGGNGNDSGTGHTEPGGNGQDITDNFLGKVLRIDVSGDQFADPDKNYRIPNYHQANTNPFAPVPDPAHPGQFIDSEGDDEIWAYGLRNPFRAGFDRATGDLWIGDVGQETREEVDFQPAASTGGENYGWRLREGFIQNPSSVGGAKPPGYVDPVYDYKHPGASGADPNFTGRDVIGGVPYRGPDPTLQGVYFFTDNDANKLWTLTPSTTGGLPMVSYVSPQLPPDPADGFFSAPSSITEDSVGNLYVTYLSGSVWRIVTDAFTPGDFNGDANVDAADVGIWQAGFGTQSGADRTTGDVDGDGDVDGADYLLLQRNFGWSALNVATAASTAVPEPASVLMLSTALAYMARRRVRMARLCITLRRSLDRRRRANPRPHRPACRFCRHRVLRRQRCRGIPRPR